ncbi:HTH-type transcriptional regulator RutR [Pantoea stewartii]|uniref:HTH-type transcriptional regulator RutR n=1 Tax=Pantoea stewartii TaxID=66269 RepID=UPI0021D4B481|nr:HTH-type transcriptional regulator RutR [Pantoea stewartii]MCU7369000.1 HTH-type transcriptional regulator RutR [Pantoea stewartii]
MKPLVEHPRAAAGEQKSVSPGSKTTTRRSRAVAAKRGAIMTAALEFFSLYGFHGTRLEQVAERADVSKTNLFYYFPTKEALYIDVLKGLLDIWLAPLKALQPDQHPLEAIREYIRLKLCVSRDHPQASRLFCLEMVQGAPLLKQELGGGLKTLVEEKCDVIRGWIKDERIAPVDPMQLIFMLWATTQHYADFSVQVEAITGKTLSDPAFFDQTVKNLQHIITEGIQMRA